MMKNDSNTKTLQFTSEELDLIYDALEEMRFSGENEEEVAALQSKIAALFQNQE